MSPVAQRADELAEPADALAPFDPERVLADHDGRTALAEVVGMLRSIGYDGRPHLATGGGWGDDAAAVVLVALARREPVTESELVGAIGSDSVAALLRCGALAVVPTGLVLTPALLPMRSVYTVLPGPRPGHDTVYLGPDSLALFELVWAARGHGDRAVDLATGNGFVAAAMATRYDHVIAADLSARCVATAALVPVLNPHLRSRFAAVRLDVAAGLEAGAFDLVTGNPPWVPETVGPDGGPPRRFAAGGPTGFELPRRFLDAAADLLAPGGRAFIACLDLTFADGRRPLAEHAGRLTARSLDVTIVETRLNQTFDYTTWARGKLPDAVATCHVVVELRRPG